MRGQRLGPVSLPGGRDTAPGRAGDAGARGRFGGHSHHRPGCPAAQMPRFARRLPPGPAQVLVVDQSGGPEVADLVLGYSQLSGSCGGIRCPRGCGRPQRGPRGGRSRPGPHDRRRLHGRARLGRRQHTSRRRGPAGDRDRPRPRLGRRQRRPQHDRGPRATRPHRQRALLRALHGQHGAEPRRRSSPSGVSTKHFGRRRTTTSAIAG